MRLPMAVRAAGAGRCLEAGEERDTAPYIRVVEPTGAIRVPLPARRAPGWVDPVLGAAAAPDRAVVEPRTTILDMLEAVT